MSQGLIARRYAKALLNLAENENEQYRFRFVFYRTSEEQGRVQGHRRIGPLSRSYRINQKGMSLGLLNWK